MIGGVYITKTEALAEGFTHEGRHFGVPVWVEYDEGTGEMGCVAAKCAVLEPVLDIGVGLTQFFNTFRDPCDEFLFAFSLRPIE